MEVTEHLTNWEFWEIRSLYPMVGLTSLVVTPGYLACWLLERPKVKSEDRIKEKEDCKKVDIGCRRQVALKKITQISHFRWLLVSLMAVYYFAFIGVESSLRTFTSTFAVSSSLKLTRAQVGISYKSQFKTFSKGSDLLAFFYLTFAVSRALVIPLSIWVRRHFIF